jgi:predicted CXXCH cytochrome family protein
MKDLGTGSNHKPYTEGKCLDCHDPHGSAFRGLLVADQKSTCLKCHPNLAKEGQGAKSVHGSFEKGECSKCHNPHKAGLPKLLLAKTPDLCFGCHKEMGLRAKDEKAHAPFEGCLDCHKPHAAPQPQLLGEPAGKLCEQCHEGKDAGFQKGHLAIDPAKMTCTSCHTPHTSKSAKLFKKNVHPPFAAKQCDACHAGGKG